jgi:thiol-disulfide isomerase/thioredoxin
MTARTTDLPVRTADPYRDIEVIDSRAPRFNQAVIGSLALIAFLVDWWPLLAILAAQLVVGLLFGRRYCLPCVAYFEWVQPRFGEGAIEDSRPPRFANAVGAVVLTAASVLHLVGLTVAGWALGLLVAGLALLAAVTGLCVGCELYKWGARLRRVRTGQLRRVDLTDLDGPLPDEEIVIQFTHPWCTDCQTLAAQLRSESRPVVEVDVSQRPDLGRKYGIAAVPVAVAVDSTGEVTARLHG